MINQKFVPFISAVAQLQIDSETKARIAASAVAAAVSSSLSLPGTQANGDLLFYGENLAIRAQELIGQFNEQAVLDVNLACELVRKFWQVRYAVLFGHQVRVADDGNFFLGFTGAGWYFSVEELAFLNEHAVAITTIQREAQQSLS